MKNSIFFEDSESKLHKHLINSPSLPPMWEAPEGQVCLWVKPLLSCHAEIHIYQLEISSLSFCFIKIKHTSTCSALWASSGTGGWTSIPFLGPLKKRLPEGQFCMKQTRLVPPGPVSAFPDTVFMNLSSIAFAFTSEHCGLVIHLVILFPLMIFSSGIGGMERGKGSVFPKSRRSGHSVFILC